MQKLAREYLDELNKRHKKNRRALVAWILMAVLVVGGVMGTLAQYGVAFEGSPECGKEEHTHDDGCYTETRELTCDLAEGEEHTHDDVCYTVSKELACELEEHSHGDECVKEPESTEAPYLEETTTAPADDNTEPEGTAAETETQPVTEDDSTETTAPGESADSEETTESVTETETEPETETETETEVETEIETEETLPAEFEATEKINDGKVEIHVTAKEGVLPEGAQLKAVPVVKQDIEKLKKRDGVTSEEIEATREINEKYDAVYPALEKTIPEDEIKKIAGFTAYDISFLAPDEDGEMTEFEPQGEVGVEIKFSQAFLPESVADHEGIEITDVNLVHMRESGKELIAETMEDAEFVLTEDSEVRNVSFSSEDFSIYAVAWTRGPQRLEYEDDDVIISVEEAEIGNIPEGAALNVVPVVEENEETEEQYKTIEEKLKEGAEGEDYVIAGFFAYDFSLANENDEIVNLQGDVKVSIEYKEATAPGIMVPELTNVSMAMLDMDDKSKDAEPKTQTQSMSGKVTSAVQTADEPAVIDLEQNNQVNALDVTEKQQIQKTEIVLDSFEPVLLALWTEEYRIIHVDIVDDVVNTGRLNVNVKIQDTLNYNEVPVDTLIVAGHEVRYVWYKSTDGGTTFNEVKRQQFANNEFNVDVNGSWLNLILDDGGLSDQRSSVKYKAEIYIDNLKAEAFEEKIYSVPYWNELQNGSFEKPVIVGKTYDQFEMYESEGLVWKTTDVSAPKGEHIEIVTASSGHIDPIYRWYGNTTPPDGVQFAELNCEGEGALYQDVLTIPGENLNYWFSHRARGWNPTATPESDTMYVVIAPTKLAKGGFKGDGNAIDTQAEVLELIKNINQYDGAYVREYTSDDQAWYAYEGTYIPTEYMTRFFFVAGKTTAGITQGNFLDRVGFSQKLPPAQPGKVELRVTKKIEGLTLEELNLGTDLSETEISEKIRAEIIKELPDLKFDIKATDKTGNNAPNAPCVNEIDENGNGGLSIRNSDWTWTVDDDGSYVGNYKVSGEIGDYEQLTFTVTEIGGEIPSYTLQEELEISGGTVSEGNDGKDMSTTLKEGETAAFKFTNTYSQDLSAKLQIEKTITGLEGTSLSQLQSDMCFDVELIDPATGNEPVKYEDLQLTFNESGKGVCSIENVLPGATYKITEKNAAIEGYELSVTADIGTVEKDSSGNAWIRVTVPTFNEISSEPAKMVTTVQFTNAYQQNKMAIDLVKYGSTYETDPLSGASFSLYKGGYDSETKELTWAESPMDTYSNFEVVSDGTPELSLAPGIYKLVETKAPDGYQILNDSICFKIEHNRMILIDETGNTFADGSQNELQWKLEDPNSENAGVYKLSILNQALYELPSTGGSGIYRYMISGVLLMMAGMLILYNNKRARRCAGV